jgi:hypothetical protein
VISQPLRMRTPVDSAVHAGLARTWRQQRPVRCSDHHSAREAKHGVEEKLMCARRARKQGLNEHHRRAQGCHHPCEQRAVQRLLCHGTSELDSAPAAHSPRTHAHGRALASDMDGHTPVGGLPLIMSPRT